MRRRRGTKQAVCIRFNRSPEKLHVCALSFGHRTGLLLGGNRMLHLRPDTLFLLSLGRDILGVTSSRKSSDSALEPSPAPGPIDPRW